MMDGTPLDAEYLNNIGCGERESEWENLVKVQESATVDAASTVNNTKSS
jgi:hypothetical protein